MNEWLIYMGGVVAFLAVGMAISFVYHRARGLAWDYAGFWGWTPRIWRNLAAWVAVFLVLIALASAWDYASEIYTAWSEPAPRADPNGTARERANWYLEQASKR